MLRDDLRLYAITDRTWLKQGEELENAVKEAILGGVTMIQLREKHLEYDELKSLALKVQAVCHNFNVPFIINDNVELAAEIDADGVHVGQSDMSVSNARKLLGPGKIVGATAKTIEQAKLAEKSGADYLGSGAIFGTTTKLDAKSMTMELLNSICDSVDIPVVAIGGIDETNAGKLKDTHIAGVAVVSGIFAKPNPRRAAISLNNILYGRKVIQCITNHVTVNEVANVILAVGASPIMAHHKMEVLEVQKKASALLINLGATDDYEACKIAYKTAVTCGHPIVIDPVGVGASSFRRDFLKSLFEIGTPTCIRGNLGEIRAIYDDYSRMNGLDDDSIEESDENNIACRLAAKLNCIVVATGKTDYICDGKITFSVCSGTPMQKNVTGSGCMLSGVVCAMLALSGKSLASVAAYACEYMGDTAKKADISVSNMTDAAMTADAGSMSFLTRWIDYVSIM